MSTDCNPHPTEARALSNERIQRQPWYYYIFFSRGPASFLQLITNFSSLAACSFLSRPLPGACFTLLEVSRSFGRLPQVTFVSLKHLAREGTLPSRYRRAVCDCERVHSEGEERREKRLDTWGYVGRIGSTIPAERIFQKRHRTPTSFVEYSDAVYSAVISNDLIAPASNEVTKSDSDFCVFTRLTGDEWIPWRVNKTAIRSPLVYERWEHATQRDVPGKSFPSDLFFPPGAGPARGRGRTSIRDRFSNPARRGFVVEYFFPVRS